MSQPSSITRKVTMSLSGLFLLVFLPVHLLINSFTLINADLFNEASHFMASNPLIQIMQPVLGIGFIVHILMGIRLELQNKAARPIDYAYSDQGGNSTWASRNMIITGMIIMAFLGLHLANYFIKMKFTGMGGLTDYELVVNLFSNWYYVAIYEIAFILLGIHLIHGFASAFQSVGVNHSRYNQMIKIIAHGYVTIIILGFIIIPILHCIGIDPFCAS